MAGRVQKQESRAVNLRMREDVRSLIDRAAKIRGKSRSDFMIEAARQAAEDALIGQTCVQVALESFERYREILDKPPRGEGYERLMNAPRPWED